MNDETVVLVTAQAPKGEHVATFAAADFVAKSMRLAAAPKRGLMSRVFGRA